MQSRSSRLIVEQRLWLSEHWYILDVIQLCNNLFMLEKPVPLSSSKMRSRESNGGPTQGAGARSGAWVFQFPAHCLPTQIHSIFPGTVGWGQTLFVKVGLPFL